MRNQLVRTLVIAVTATALGACALAPLSSQSPEASASPSPAPSASAAPTPTATPFPSATPSAASPSPAPDQALVRIEHTGGFVPQESLFTHYPMAVLYADGRLITQGAVPAIYPGPALPSLIQTRITPAGVADILQAARQAGLSGPDRKLGQPMPDVGQVVFTIVYPNGDTHRTTLYPQFGESSPSPDMQAVLDFASLLTDPRASLPGQVVGGDQPYDFDRLRVISRATSRNNSPDPSLVTVKNWPLDSLATIGQELQQFGATYRCVAVDGSDLATLLPQVQAANQLTLWKSDGQLYSVIFHPLLPDDPDCPAAHQ